MGIKKLNKFWQKINNKSIEKIHLSKLRDKTIAIDFNLYLYRFLLTNKETYLKSFFFQILKFLKYGIKPIYVFDGKKPKQKIITIEKRRQKKRNLEEKVEKYKLVSFQIL